MTLEKKTIPACCPACGEADGWKEVINPFTTGIPIGKHIRIRLIQTRGFDFHQIEYRCKMCGYENKYDDRDRA